ncbi:hypothetical protein CEP52_012822 [Fusarium oligoseptatum]|uniref:Autophagy-related protein 1 n=1 Tax=Fusarium oligoseptatum TaxID=2604345 RepID=A0A428SWG7_9HYPO|nr:hypothetical protein CEP52_012822 [Fusarium oligoseptatum]
MAWTIFTVKTSDYIVLHSHNQAYWSTMERKFKRDLFAPDSPTEHSESGTPAPPPLPPLNILRFTTEHMPKDPSAGFVFGTNKDKCDVLLHNSRDSGISGRQFAITFRTDTGAMILRNHSRVPTQIKLPNEGLVDLDTQRVFAGTGDIEIYLPTLDVTLSKPWEDGEDGNEYTDFLARLGSIAPDLGTMRLQSSAATTASSALSLYHLDRLIGHGASATVYRACHIQTGEVVAAKCFGKNSRIGDPWKECVILSSLRHDHIIRFYEFSVRGEDGPQLIMEFAACGSLLDQSQSRNFTDREGRTIIRQTLEGLKYLHGKRVIHRDLKPGNILLATRKPIHVKVADFGISGSAADEYNTQCGTELYAAPELWNPPYTEKIDIWSVGIIVMELWVGLPKYNRDTWAEDVMARKKRAPKDVRRFLHHLLQSSSGKRLPARDCLNLPFVRPRHKYDGVPNLHPLQKPRLGIESQDPTVPFNGEMLDTAIWNPVGPEASYAPVNPELPDEVPDLATWNARGAANLGTECQDPTVPFNDENLDTAIWNPGPGATSNWPQGAAIPQINSISGIPIWHPLDPNSWITGGDPDNAPSAAQATLATPEIRTSIRMPNKPQTYNGFDFLPCGNTWIPYHPDDRTVNITRILKTAGFPRYKLSAPELQGMMSRKVILRGYISLQGTFIPYEDAICICNYLEIESNFLDAYR